jgi:hypothetical protein
MITTTAQRLGISPRGLAAIFSFETGGTFNPAKWGGTGGRHLGLIQFGPAEQREFGIYDGMTVAEQMPAVEAFLRQRFARRRVSLEGADLAKIYSVINTGHLINGEPDWNASDGRGHTLRGHVDEIQRRHLPGVSRYFPL